MPTYTLVVTAASGHQHVTATEFSDDATAIADAAGVLTEEHPTIAVARGLGGEAEFLGAWNWSDDQPKWTPEE